ncbi:MAG: hypothetical protein RBT34_01385 [Anaerolineaceae bacterium]|jgi:hypothetical protein|nr:hypothetical protein [Anaerolineaceae bacterium]
MQRKWFILMFLFALVTLSCGFFSSDKDDSEALPDAPAAAVDAPQAEVQHSGPAVEQPSVEEQPSQEMEAPAPSFASDAPKFFTDEFDSETADPNWFDEYSYFVDEDVEEDDDEYTPSYSIEQRRGALRFEIESPFLYLYHVYGPHLYEDVRIDFEIENKGVNTNNVGAICRYTDYGWYEFITTSGGYYSIMRYYEDGNKELATGGIKSIRFGTEKKNVYTFICKGRTLILAVNGVEIAKVKDEEIPDAGYAGINISSESVVPVQVEINWLQISQPE